MWWAGKKIFVGGGGGVGSGEVLSWANELKIKFLFLQGVWVVVGGGVM